MRAHAIDAGFAVAARLNRFGLAPASEDDLSGAVREHRAAFNVRLALD